MRGRSKKSPRQKDQTDSYRSDVVDEDRVERHHRFTDRSKHYQRDKTARTAARRADDQVDQSDWTTLPIGSVVQVFSRYIEVERDGTTWLCQARKTMSKVADSQIVVGDFVRFRPGAGDAEKREATIEQVLPRRTILTRSDSFKAITQHPIVANAEQMLIVASVIHPRVKWGLIDRMLIAAQAGGLTPLLVLNKIDLAPQDQDEYQFASEALAHYASLRIQTFEASVTTGGGIDAIRRLLKDRTTVLTGHSGVGKSSLITAIQPNLDLRTAPVSRFNEKGRHTTTGARRYDLEIGGVVIDTPGVKLFGLWNVTRESLIHYFPDVEAEAAPSWRTQSYARIEASLGS
ncbi:MAG: ribosome small subunit-dependent GTPase A [Tepidisphaeraceae bacterium]